jgi:hypothetical protein
MYPYCILLQKTPVTFMPSVVEAFSQTWGNGIDPAAVPGLLRHFKLCASMLAEYLEEAHNPPINDYQELEGFECD